MKGKTKRHWDVGDVFAVPLKDGTRATGQVLDLMMKNVASCALFDVRISDADVNEPLERLDDRVISLVSTTRERLDSGQWRVIGKRPLAVKRSLWPNEKFRNVGWVGAEIHNATFVEDFLNAFYALAPWDDWADPHELDAWLVSPAKKPKRLLFKRA